jgi:WD40 repeat protein/DNA-binding SARP family transcriptional activator
VALEIRVLGRVDALIDGQALPLGGSKQRAVLAMLALRANRTVAAEELIDGLWGDRPPAKPAKNLQHYVWRLRRALVADDSGARIVTRGRGYELQLPEDAVDAARFEHLVERARREAEQGIADGAAKGALELWRGAPLADVASEPFAGAEIRRLEELHLRAIELEIDAELAAGHHDDVIATLEALIAEHPTHERFHAQRMLALYRAGRQSDAVDGYRAAHRTLVEEIGVEPGPELRELQEAILRHDPSLDARPPRELPRQLEGGSPLIAGRDRELRWLRKRWAEAEAGRTRTALVSGPPGIGKTRLAAELAGAVQPEAAVQYAAGSGAPDAALEAIRGAEQSELPTLVVLDDADDASPALLEAAATLADTPRESTVLLLVLHRGDEGPPAFADTAQRLLLRPLRVEAVAEIAELYAPAEGVEMPLETLMADSEGVPLRVHRVASGWAQAHAAEQLESAADTAAVDQDGLRAARAKVAGSVSKLQLARERTDLYVVEEPADPSAPEVCPFRGLAPFDAAHAEYFFGRERLVADLSARLVGSTLLAVVGASGSGKSSVIRAGLLPSLADGVLPGSERWRQVVMRPGEHPVAELRRAVARVQPDQSQGEGEPDGDDPFAAALESLRADERLVLAVDQFEEIFTACRDEGERAAFADALAALADDADRRALVVLGIRGDFYGRGADYAELSGHMSANTVLVGAMRRDELRRAIELPARRAGLRVEPRLTSALIGDVADEPGGLPLLSTTLVELWEERSGRTLRRASYEVSGGVSGAVARLAERAYQQLSAPQRERARAILLRLTDAEQPAPVRRRVALTELEVEKDENTAGALAVLTESRLVTVDEGTVEVAHEALLSQWPRLRGWLEEDAAGRRLHQHLIHAAAEWQGSGRDPAELYRGARLASALEWAAEHNPELNELEHAFLEESRAASEREAERQRRTNRRLRALLAGVGVLLAAAVVAGVIAISERQGARDAETAQLAQRLGAQALVEEDLDRSLLLARQAVAIDDSPQTRSYLFSDLVRTPAVTGVMHGESDILRAIAVSPDGKTLAVGDYNTGLLFFDARTYERIGEPLPVRDGAGGAAEQGSVGLVESVAYSPDGETVAVGGARYIRLIDARTREQLAETAVGGVAMRMAFTKDGSRLVALIAPGTARGLGAADAQITTRDAATLAATGPPIKPEGFAGAYVGSYFEPPSFALAPDGRSAITASDEDQLVWWNLRSRTPTRRLAIGAGKHALALSPDGRTIAVGIDRGIQLVDTRSGAVRTAAGALGGAPSWLLFSPDGETVVSTSLDGTVALWDAESGTRRETLRGHSGAVQQPVFSPDGETLYTVGHDGTAIAWDIGGERGLGRHFTFTHDRHANQGGYDTHPGSFSPDGRLVAVGLKEQGIRLWDATDLTPVGPPLSETGGEVFSLAFTPDGQTLAAVTLDGQATLWDVERRSLLRGPFSAGIGDVLGSSISADGAILAAPGPEDWTGFYHDPNEGGVNLWEVATGEPLDTIALGVPAGDVAFSPAGQALAFVHERGGTAEVWDVAERSRIAKLPVNSDSRFYYAIAFSPDGRTLATGGLEDPIVRVWDVPTGKLIRELDQGSAGVKTLDFSPDGRILAVSGYAPVAQLWDVATGARIGPTLRAGSRRADIDLSPDGRELLMTAADGRGALWDVDPESWARRACTLANRTLTPEEWEEFLPGRPYEPACGT